MKKSKTPMGIASNNTFGLDAPYFSKKLKLVLQGLNNYTPQELARELSRLAKTSDEVVASGELSHALKAKNESAECRIAQLEADLAEAKLSDRDKEDLEIGKQIRRAAACLPDYFDIKVHVENGFAGVTLIDTVGKIRDFDFDENLSSAISEAIDAAIKEQQ